MTEHRPRASSARFTCVHCGRHADLAAVGTRHRNHCPHCLWSRHVDERTGDRKSACKAPMEPVAIASRRDGEWSVVHRCVGCARIRINRTAGDDNVLVLLALALKPLSTPAFPIEHLPALFRAPGEE